MVKKVFRANLIEIAMVVAIVYESVWVTHAVEVAEEAALQLFAVQRADQKLREKLENHFLRPNVRGGKGSKDGLRL